MPAAIVAILLKAPTPVGGLSVWWGSGRDKASHKLIDNAKVDAVDVSMDAMIDVTNLPQRRYSPQLNPRRLDPRK